MNHNGRIARPVQVIAFATIVAIATVAAARPQSAAGRGGVGARHVHLVKSEPAANDTVRVAPTAIRLWFSQQPELAITSVKLASSTGAAIPLAPVSRDTGATAPIVASLRGALAAGAYVVTWRTTAADGHLANGTIPFVVAATR